MDRDCNAMTNMDMLSLLSYWMWPYLVNYVLKSPLLRSTIEVEGPSRLVLRHTVTTITHNGLSRQSVDISPDLD